MIEERDRESLAGPAELLEAARGQAVARGQTHVMLGQVRGDGVGLRGVAGIALEVEAVLGQHMPVGGAVDGVGIVD